MLKPIQFIRLLKINVILARYMLNRSVLGPRTPWLRNLSYLNPLSFSGQAKTRGESIRMAFESLGPIFVKFGQLLSTRHTLFPDDIMQELTKLQDQVPPFATDKAIKMIEAALGKPIQSLFARFDLTPLASASIAQVHSAQLQDGSEVVIKVLRPNIRRVILHDIAILYSVARLTERFWSQGKRLHLSDLVAEFEQTILDELDLSREAANASQLRRNFSNSEKMYVPKIYWDLTKRNVMTMERIYGIQISNITALNAKHTNMKKLAEYGVEIFFTQVFRDSFFHADMHPGNLFVDASDPENPKYLGIDFGIMGSLDPSDQHYLAANLLAFFNRDYRGIAILHIESGWVPTNTRVDQFESAIRTVCEPIFEKPLSEISFGQLLLRLFQTAERFHMELQPQLMLLQKTLLNVESLGRTLYPTLDLWQTAKPFLEKWMHKQHGLKQVAKEAFDEFPMTSEKLLKTPGLLHDVLREVSRMQRVNKYQPNETIPAKQIIKRGFLLGAGFACAVIAAMSFILAPQFSEPEWILIGTAAALLLLAWVYEK